jgi:hypothetical protein
VPLKTLRDLKIDKKGKRRTTKKSAVIVGDNFYSILAYQYLTTIFDKNEITIITEHKLNLNDISILGPSSIRGEHNINSFKTMFPEISLGKNRDSVFLKEKILRPFTGRSKPEELLYGERFFVSSGQQCSIEPLLNDDPTNIIETINSEAYISQISAISYENIEKNNNEKPIFKWKVATTKKAIYETDYLIWARPPWQLLEHFNNKENLDNDLIEYLNSTKVPGPLFIKFNLAQKLFNIDKTTFLPQSLTHSWGHFIGEFKELNSEFKESAEFVTYIDTDSLNEEEVAKKIRLLKKSLEKIAPEFAKSSFQENIVLSEDGPITNIKDNLFYNGKEKSKLNNMFIIGENGPLKSDYLKENSIESNTSNISHITRALIVNRQLANDLKDIKNED